MCKDCNDQFVGIYMRNDLREISIKSESWWEKSLVHSDPGKVICQGISNNDSDQGPANIMVTGYKAHSIYLTCYFAPQPGSPLNWLPWKLDAPEPAGWLWQSGKKGLKPVGNLLVILILLWPSYTIWWVVRQTLDNTMAYCLTAPSHYPNQCWFSVISNLISISLIFF